MTQTDREALTRIVDELDTIVRRGAWRADPGLAACVAALRSLQPDAAEGTVRVPVEPTDEMVKAGDLFFANESFKSVSPAQIKAIYRAMLAAAPKEKP